MLRVMHDCTVYARTHFHACNQGNFVGIFRLKTGTVIKFGLLTQRACDNLVGVLDAYDYLYCYYVTLLHR